MKCDDIILLTEIRSLTFMYASMYLAAPHNNDYKPNVNAFCRVFVYVVAKKRFQ